MRAATDSHTAMPAATADAVERALAAAIRDATRIGDLLDTLRSARLWLPLSDDGTPVTDGAAVTLPTVTYLGSEFVPAYTSAELMAQLADPAQSAYPPAAIPHAVVRAQDLARLMPPGVGIALNAGASESVPVYPQGVQFLAAAEPAGDGSRISVEPLPAQPVELLAAIRAGLARIPQARQACAAWLSVQFSGEGMIISVTLDDPSDGSVRDAVVAALEDAAQSARPDAGYPIDVTFPGEAQPDDIDSWIAAFAEPFYLRRPPR
jgi:SseB protein N-terminal domain